MSEAIIRAANRPLRAAGGVVGYVAEWAWIGGMSCGAFGGALLGERMLILVFG